MAARPKGYMKDWTPQPHVAHWIRLASQVLEEYRGYGPMTVRQVFYRLVGQHGYDKTEQAYKRLAEWLVRARRAQLIGFNQIRDDGTVEQGGGGWSGQSGFWRTVRHLADEYELDRQADQPQEIELWCEAAGMAPMLARMVSEWSIPVYSTGGFSSLTVTHEVAQRVLSRDKPTRFLHVGDYDPSGESIFKSMSQDIGAFVVGARGGSWDSETGETLELANGGDTLFLPTRVALTADQAIEHDLPTAPAKSSDARSANWELDDPVGGTVQAEAMPPDLLERVITDHVRGLIDEDALEETLERESRDKDRIDEVLLTAEEELEE